MKLRVLAAALAVVACTAGSAVATDGSPCGSCEPPKPEPVKVSLCHATGSSSNPYVLINVSENALAAHKRHGDVSPSGGKCPSPPKPPECNCPPPPPPDPCEPVKH